SRAARGPLDGCRSPSRGAAVFSRRAMWPARRQLIASAASRAQDRTPVIALVGEPMFLQLARVGVEDSHLLAPAVQITSHECHGAPPVKGSGWEVRSAVSALPTATRPFS